MKKQHTLIPLAEAARQIGLVPATLRQAVIRGRLRATKQGRDWFVTQADLNAYLSSRQTWKDKGIVKEDNE